MCLCNKFFISKIWKGISERQVLDNNDRSIKSNNFGNHKRTEMQKVTSKTINAANYIDSVHCTMHWSGNAKRQNNLWQQQQQWRQHMQKVQDNKNSHLYAKLSIGKDRWNLRWSEAPLQINCHKGRYFNETFFFFFWD